MNDEQLRFGFGGNWRDFVATRVSDTAVENAVVGLRRMLGTDDLRGRTFLDIGCGSGLSSLAALRLGADRVVAFDYDGDSVAASQHLRAEMGMDPARWQIMRGSILDPDFLRTLPAADVVYSWGVLHHTGDMWRAIDNAAALVPPGGTFAIAIYNDVEKRIGGSAMWRHVKRAYNRASLWQRSVIEALYTANIIARWAASGRNPFRMVARYAQIGGRGMSFRHDVRDWLGGYPYEYATAGRVFEHVVERHGLVLEHLNTHDGHVCNEFTFRRPG